MMQSRNFKRIIAVIVVLAMLIVMLFSTQYLCKNINHHCTGEDCPICAMVLQCSNNLRTIGTAIIMIAVAISLIATKKNVFFTSTNVFKTNSLLSQRVRFNN